MKAGLRSRGHNIEVVIIMERKSSGIRHMMGIGKYAYVYQTK